MKWYSYSYSMPCFRVRVRVLLTRSTSTKSQGKHRLILRNMRIAQLQSAPVAVAYGSDRLGTIDLPCATGGVFQCRAIVPNSSPRRASGGVLRFSAVYPTGHGPFWFRSIGDNRSTIPATASSSVELLSPIAPPDALAAAACGFRLLIPPATVPSGSDRLGTIDLPSQRGF
jgi:hypothetical protein